MYSILLSGGKCNEKKDKIPDDSSRDPVFEP